MGYLSQGRQVGLLSNPSLFKKALLFVLIGVLVGMGVFSLVSFQALNQSTQAMLRERLSLANLIADYGDETLGRALDELQAVSERVSAPDANLTSELNGLRTTYSRLGIFTQSLFVTDSAGRITSVLPADPALVGADVSSYPAIRQSLASGNPVVSGLVQAPLTGRPVVLLAVRLLGARGDATGAVVATVDVARSSLGVFIQPTRLGKTGYTEIVDQDGLVLVRTNPGNPLSPFEVSDHQGKFAALIKENKPTTGACHTCHEAGQRVGRDVLAFAPLSRVPWGVVVRQAESEALSFTQDLRRRLEVMGALFLVLSLGAAWVAARDVVGRVRLLEHASRKMSAGDLDSQIPVRGKDEIGSLGQSFEDTRIKLKASYQEVALRTGELSAMLAVSQALSTTGDFPAFLEEALAKAGQSIANADGGALILNRKDRGQFLVQAIWRLEGLPPPPFIMEKTSTQAASREGLPVTSASTEELNSETRELSSGICHDFVSLQPLSSRVKSVLHAPLLYRGDYLGSILFLNFKPDRTFGPEDSHLLRAIAGEFAIAVENAELSKEAREAKMLREMDRLKSQFISTVSHELRTPLTSIKGYATSLLRKDVQWDEETKLDFLKTIDEKSDELRELIEKLLQMSKLEAGALRLEKEPVLLPKLAQKAAETAAARSGRHTFALEFPTSFPVLEGDARCLEQVLRNLVDNAIKYSPDGGKVTIGGYRGDREVVAYVRDEGIGIAPEHQGKIFERFYRVDSPLVRGTSGSGLGLPIARGLVEAHGGRMWVESGPDKGSTFYFALPVDNERRPDVPASDLKAVRS